MLISKKITLTGLLLLVFSLIIPQPALAQKSKKKTERSAIPVLWRDPGDISSRDILNGPGAPELAPAAPFTFIKENKGGESPKFDVKDARGVEWRVKLGPEAQSET